MQQSNFREQELNQKKVHQKYQITVQNTDELNECQEDLTTNRCSNSKVDSIQNDTQKISKQTQQNFQQQNTNKNEKLVQSQKVSIKTLSRREERPETSGVEPNHLNQNESTYFSNQRGGAQAPTPPDNHKRSHPDCENIQQASNQIDPKHHKLSERIQQVHVNLKINGHIEDPQQIQWAGDATTDYVINDFNINELPEDNPLQMVIEDFQSRRAAFFSKKNNSANSSGQGRPQVKPQLSDFLKCFCENVQILNTTYRSSKQQFENDMKAYKDNDGIEQEDEYWTQQMSGAPQNAKTPSFAQKKECDAILNQLQNPINVPLNGPLKSVPLIVQQQMGYSNSNGNMIGNVIQVPLTKKQQRSQTVHNYVQYLADFYDGFQIQPNCLQGFYPKMVQKHIQKKKNQNPERIVSGMRGPQYSFPSSICSDKKSKKAINKMRMLSKFQSSLMQVVLQKIDRRSKPIRKQTKIVQQSLEKKKIYLDQENFDILSLLQQNQQKEEKSVIKQKSSKHRKMEDQSIPEFDMEQEYSQEISEMQNINSENICTESRQSKPKKQTKAEMKKMEKEKKIKEKEDLKRFKEQQLEAAKLAKKKPKEEVEEEAPTKVALEEVSNSPQMLTPPEYSEQAPFHDIMIDEDDPLKEKHEAVMLGMDKPEIPKKKKKSKRHCNPENHHCHESQCHGCDFERMHSQQHFHFEPTTQIQANCFINPYFSHVHHHHHHHHAEPPKEPAEDMIIPSPGQMQQFFMAHQHTNNADTLYSPNRAFGGGNDLNFYSSVNQMSALYAGLNHNVNISPNQNQYNFVNNANRLMMAAMASGQTHTGESKENLMQLHQHMQQFYMQSQVSEWAPVLHPVPNEEAAVTPHKQVKKPSQLTLQSQIKSVDVNPHGYFNNHVIQRESAQDDFYSQPGYNTSITPKAALFTNRQSNQKPK